MRPIKQSYTIKVPLEKVWQALTDPKEIEVWGAGPAKMTSEKGAEFSLWDGDIFGKNTKVIENKLLVQDWYGGKWDRPSKVTIELSSDGDSTTIELTHEDLPEGEIQNFADGWREYYFGPMKEYLEK